MEQGTNSQGAQFRPISINYGGIIQNHIRYMRKYKDQQEAQKYARKVNEREFQRKLANDREKLLPEIGIGEAQGYWRDQRVEQYKKEQQELSNIKQQFKNTGDPKYKLQYDRRRLFYEDLNSLTESSSAFLKYINENKKEYNEDLDKGLLNLASTLQGADYEIVKSGVRIPAKDGILDLFNLSKDDADNDGFVIIQPSVLSEKFINSGKFSGKVDFDDIGTNIAENINLNDVNGNLERTPEKENASIRSWKSHLLDNEILAKTHAKRKGVNLNSLGKDELDVFLTESATELASKYSFDKWKTVDNSFANSLKRQANARANESNARARTNSISIKKDSETGKFIVTDNSTGGALVNLPENVYYGSTSKTKGALITSFEVNDKGEIKAYGKKLSTEIDRRTNQRIATSEDIEPITDQTVLNDIVTKIPSPNGGNFKDTTEFLNESRRLYNSEPDAIPVKREAKKDAFGNPID